MRSQFLFKIKLFVMLVMLSTYKPGGLLQAQSTIAFQGFEGNVLDNWTYNSILQNAALPQVLVGPANYGAGYSFSGTNSLRIGGGSQTCGSGSPNCINGSISGGSCNNNQNGAEVTFSEVDISCYKNIRISVAHRTHLLCTSPVFQGQGLDSGDRVLFDVSQNGGAFVTTATINGFNNCTWDYSTLAACTGPSVANPYTYNVPAGTNSISFRVRLQINRSDEVLYLDHVSLVGDPKISGFSYPSIICVQDGFIAPNLETGFDEGGTFSTTAGLVFDPISGIIDPGNSVPGTYTLFYSYGGNACSSFTITIQPTPTTTPIYHE